ncbi:MAG: acyl carrier protein [Geobacteraceae bacterium]
MNTEEIESILIQGISSIKNLEPSEVASEKSFHDLGIDSLGFVEILVFIEKTFKLELIASALTKQDFESVHSLASSISRSL